MTINRMVAPREFGPGPSTVSTKELSRICGASLRQLQWWSEADIVKPLVDDANRRIWSQTEAVATCLLADLRKRNVSGLRRARRLVDSYRKRLAVAGGVPQYLVIAKLQHVWLATAFEVIRYAATVASTVAVVDMREIAERVICKRKATECSQTASVTSK